MQALIFAALLLSCPGAAPPRGAAPVRVVVWDEQQPAQKKAYANFLGNEIR
jgi:hypothetical protein